MPHYIPPNIVLESRSGSGKFDAKRDIEFVKPFCGLYDIFIKRETERVANSMREWHGCSIWSFFRKAGECPAPFVLCSKILNLMSRFCWIDLSSSTVFVPLHRMLKLINLINEESLERIDNARDILNVSVLSLKVVVGEIKSTLVVQPNHPHKGLFLFIKFLCQFLKHNMLAYLDFRRDEQPQLEDIQEEMYEFHQYKIKTEREISRYSDVASLVSVLREFREKSYSKVFLGLNIDGVECKDFDLENLKIVIKSCEKKIRDAKCPDLGRQTCEIQEAKRNFEEDIVIFTYRIAQEVRDAIIREEKARMEAEKRIFRVSDLDLREIPGAGNSFVRPRSLEAAKTQYKGKNPIFDLIFEGRLPKSEDVRQGSVATCSTSALLAAIAATNPQALVNAVEEYDVKKGEITFRIYGDKSEFYDKFSFLRYLSNTPPNSIISLTIEDSVLGRNFLFFDPLKDSSYGNQSGALWPKIFEKLMIARSSLASCLPDVPWYASRYDMQINSNELLPILIGAKQKLTSVSEINAKRVFEEIKKCLKNGRPVVLASGLPEDLVLYLASQLGVGSGLLRGHVYSVIGTKNVNGKSVLVIYNPWGHNGFATTVFSNGTFECGLKELIQEKADVFYAGKRFHGAYDTKLW
ncbi:MAG: hypothetical protein LBK29_03975 [Oscillospiraceae bacterium]|jgi:hypothetical protein|nr:hypothetical protein [Oscillospiraceae bacterium]